MNLLNLEDEKFKTVEVRGYKFKIKYIAPEDRINIINRRVALQNNSNVESFTQAEYNFFDAIAKVDVCVEEMPKDFNQNVSCIKWPDSDLIFELANEIQTHSDDIEAKLKKNKPTSGGE